MVREADCQRSMGIIRANAEDGDVTRRGVGVEQDGGQSD